MNTINSNLSFREEALNKKIPRKSKERMIVITLIDKVM